MGFGPKVKRYASLALMICVFAFAQASKAADSLINADLFKAMTLVVGASTVQSLKEIPFDFPIPRFENTEAGKKYMSEHGGDLPRVRNSFGYPPAVTKFIEKKAPSSSPTPSKSGLNWKQMNLMDSANADVFPGDWDPAHPEIVNCRTSTSVTGYFKAYFEDFIANSGSSNNAGYAHPTLGLARRAAVCQVLIEIAGLINLQETGVAPDLVFHANLPPNLPSNALAAASAFYGLVQSSSGLDNGTLHDHILSRNDPTPGPNSFDAEVFTNWNMHFTDASGMTVQNSWYTDQNEGPALQWYDFKTVMKHEIFHALGFVGPMSDSVLQTGTEVFHSTFNENSFSTSPVSTSSRFFDFNLPLSPKVQAPVGSPSSWFVNNQGIYQGTINASGATPSGARALFNPSGWQQGSSLSHFDQNRSPTPLGTSYVMHPSIGPGEIRILHSHEIEVLCHLGYQVEGVCDVPTPYATDDTFSLNSATQCIPLLNNDHSYTSAPVGANTNLVVHDLQWILQPSGITTTYYSNSYDCGITGGASTTASGPSGAKSIKVTGNANLLAVSFKYRVRDTVSNRTSPSVLVYLSNCNSSPNEFVCNGNFELGAINESSLDGNFNAAFWSSQIPYWFSEVSCDLVFKNRSGYQSHIVNLPYVFTVSPYIHHHMGDNGSYAAHCATIQSSVENMITRLKSNLTAGHLYELSFDVFMEKTNGTLTDLNVIAGLSNDCIADGAANAFCANQTTSPSANAYPVVNQSIPIGNSVVVSGTNFKKSSWIHVTKTFQPTENYKYLVIGTGQISSLIGVYTYYDNVSIKKVNAVNTISGLVYNDINQSGTQNPGELPLTNRVVGLYSNTNPPVLLQTSNTGSVAPYTYSFTFSSNYQSSYLIALVSESDYQSITDPVTNVTTLISGFQHVKSVSYSGGHLNDINFGVFLNGQTLPTPTPKASPTPGPNNIVCAGAPPSTNYITLSNSTNNVPLYMCYLNSAKECVYNFTNPAGPITNGWISGCPLTVGGETCCGWRTACGSGSSSTVVNSAITPASGTSGGAVNITVTGLAPFTYQWSNGATTEDLTNVGPGTYTVTVKNVNGCMTQKTFVIGTAMQVTLAKTETCDPNSNSITATVSGGIVGYTYTWIKINPTTGAITPLLNAGSTASGLGAGTYAVTVTDATGQVLTSSSTTIYSYPALSISYTKVDASNAPTFNNGSITATVGGGVAPYTYYWSGLTPIGPTSSITNTRSGITGSSTNEYSVYVKDSRGCSTTRLIKIKVYNKLSAVSWVGRSCLTSPEKAAIVITPSGGHPPYTYLWSNGANASSLSGTAVGTYSVTVKDSTNATTQQVVLQNLQMPSTLPALHTMTASVTNASGTLNNGSVTINVTGGIGPYAYTYTPGTAYPNIATASHSQSGLAPGSYSVLVKTSQGCVSSKPFSVTRTLSPTKTTY